MRRVAVGMVAAASLALTLVLLATVPYRTVAVSRFVEDGEVYTLELGGMALGSASGSRRHSTA
jgi:hypothetical protein